MPDRIPRPPIRAKGALPDGNLNGAGDVAAHFRGADPSPKYSIVEWVARDRIHHYENGEDVAVIGMAAIEFPGAAGQLELERMILDWRAARTSAGTLPFDEAYESNDADRALDLAHRIQVWADLNSADARTSWEAFFGPYGDGVPTGPKGGSLEHLLQFCEHYGIPTRDEPAAVPDEPEPDGPDDDVESGWDDVPPGRAVLDADLPDSEPATAAFSDTH